jgi:hypothetical protein
MKLIGKNSVSKYFSYFFLVLFLFIAFHFIYEIIGFSVLYYKYKTESNILSDYFLLGNDVGWAKQVVDGSCRHARHRCRSFAGVQNQEGISGYYSESLQKVLSQEAITSGKSLVRSDLIIYLPIKK